MKVVLLLKKACSGPPPALFIMSRPLSHEKYVSNLNIEMIYRDITPIENITWTDCTCMYGFMFEDNSMYDAEHYSRTCTHAHKPTRRGTVRGCHKGKSFMRGCCTVAAY